MKAFILTFLGIILCLVGAIVITSLNLHWLVRFLLCIVYGYLLGGFIGKEIAK